MAATIGQTVPIRFTSVDELLGGNVNMWARRVAYSALITLSVVSVASCGTTSSGAAAPTVAATEASVSATVEDSPTDLPSSASPAPDESEESVTPAQEPTDAETTPTDESSTPEEEETPKPPVLDKEASGRDLTSADFFSVPEGWRDGRFNVAGQKSLAGIAGPLNDCSDEADDYTPTLELRLANNFANISMKVGESDESESSDSVVSVKLIGNGKYIDTVTVPFNRINTFRAPVANVNALKIQVWMGGKDCDSSEEVEAVLMELRVE